MFSLFKEKKMSDRNQEDQSGSESDKGAVSSQDSPDYKPYAGIGSRKMMELIAFGLGRQGFTCRTGGADGADRAFLKGSKEAFFRRGSARPELFLPWPGFNGQHSSFSIPPTAAHVIARQHHPGYDRMTQAVQKLMARNAQQVQGRDLKCNSKFVICWTPDGCIDSETRTKKTGGTGQAIGHAASLGIPVFNLAREEHYNQFLEYLKSQKLNWTMTFAEAHADLTPCEPSEATKKKQARKEAGMTTRHPKYLPAEDNPAIPK
jgi:hypothetical protein